MTREEAIVLLKMMFAFWANTHERTNVEMEMALNLALSALHPVSREQVEKVWAGCEYCEKHKINLVRIEMNYNDSPGSPKRLNPTRVPKFCPMCGRPLTDEAVEITMRRLEALNEED